MKKQYGIEKACSFSKKWRQRIWFKSKKSRDAAVAKKGGKKISREVPDDR